MAYSEIHAMEKCNFPKPIIFLKKFNSVLNIIPLCKYDAKKKKKQKKNRWKYFLIHVHRKRFSTISAHIFFAQICDVRRISDPLDLCISF